MKTTVMGASMHPALLLPPCQPQRKCHAGGITKKGAVQHPWVLALSSSALSSTEDKGITFLEAELDTFMACPGLVFPLYFFFSSPVETCSFVIGRFIVFPSDISLIT